MIINLNYITRQIRPTIKARKNEIVMFGAMAATAVVGAVYTQKTINE